MAAFSEFSGNLGCQFRIVRNNAVGAELEQFAHFIGLINCPIMNFKTNRMRGLNDFYARQIHRAVTGGYLQRFSLSSLLARLQKGQL